MENINTAPARVLLIALDLGQPDFEASLAELGELVSTAGGEVAGILTQKRSSPETATCIGSGRLEEAAQYIEANGIDRAIFDCELSPVQLRNIEKALKVKVLDRTMLIIDIFAQRARTSEGKLQVELAQLRYMLPRLSGKGTELSRLGGGGILRGSGETKLETDRRHIRRRIESLSAKLAEVETRREFMHERRRRKGTISAAIVGYTNAGKSTLLNRLTDAGVLAENKLFATLDPTARALALPGGGEIMLVDTVGFIRNLPHQLVKAFRSTLGEAANADVILLVCDGSDPEVTSQLEVSKKLLCELGAGDKPTITVINKTDMASAEHISGIEGVRICALNGDGLNNLLEAIEAALPDRPVRMRLMLPFDSIGISSRIRMGGEVLEEEYTAEGLMLTAMVDHKLAPTLKQYEIDE